MDRMYNIVWQYGFILYKISNISIFWYFKKHETQFWAREDNKYNCMLQEGLDVEEVENEEKEMQLSRWSWSQ